MNTTEVHPFWLRVGAVAQERRCSRADALRAVLKTPEGRRLHQDWLRGQAGRTVSDSRRRAVGVDEQHPFMKRVRQYEARCGCSTSKALVQVARAAPELHQDFLDSQQLRAAVAAGPASPKERQRRELIASFAMPGQERLAADLVRSGATIEEAQVALLRDARVTALAMADYKAHRARYERQGRTFRQLLAYHRARAEGRVGRPYGPGRRMTDAELNAEVERLSARVRCGTDDGRFRLPAGAGSVRVLTSGARPNRPRFRMLAYSGGVIPRHWAWNNLALDLSGMLVGKKGLPVLREHNPAAVVGHTDRVTTGNGQLEVEGVFNLVTQASREVYDLCRQGHPWQASIYFAEPLSIERVAAGETVLVNGRTLTGPGTVIREWRLREVSFCSLGSDEETEGVSLG